MGKSIGLSGLGCVLVLMGAQGANPPPTASFTATPDNGPPTLTVAVNGTASTDDGSIASWSWDWGDGSAPGTGSTTSHNYTATGTYFITLTVTDNLGATGQTTREITCISAGNAAPLADFISMNPPGGFQGTIVTFSGMCHDDTAPTFSQHWDFGDGSPIASFTGLSLHTVLMPQHTYMVPGTYVVRLRVNDAENVQATSQRTLIISPLGGGSGGGGGGGCGATGLEALLLLILLRARRGK